MDYIDQIVRDRFTAKGRMKRWAERVRVRLGLEAFRVYAVGRTTLRLDILWVPKPKQGQGIGTRAVEMLCSYADKRGLRVTLHPLPSVRSFYRRFGFQQDSQSSDMVRPAARRRKWARIAA